MLARSPLSRARWAAGACSRVWVGERRRPDARARRSYPREPGRDGDGLAPDSKAFDNYADCLDEARPEDTEALQRCADLLQSP